MNRALAIMLLSVWLCAGLVGNASAQWVTFPSAPAESLVLSEAQDVSHVLSPVRAYLSVPTRSGPHPGVVMLPACEGQRAHHQSWAQSVSEQGYVALVVDHYFLYDRGRTCDVGNPQAEADLLYMRLLHALGAAAYLAERPDVDAARLAVMGWDDAPVGILTRETGWPRPRR